MSKPVDLELKKAFAELQAKMVDTSKTIQVIDSQINVIDRILRFVVVSQSEILTLPPGTNTYDAVGRMFLCTDLEEVKRNLDMRISQLFEKTAELESNKEYLELNLKESQDNIREMVQQRKDRTEKAT